jgi:hypothetical protein
MTNDKKERATIDRLQQIIDSCRAEVDALGVRADDLSATVQAIPNVKLLECPPACNDTPAQVAEFAATLPALRVALRVGAWGHLRHLGVCWLGFCLAWCLSRLNVPQAWRAVRVR